MPVETPVSAAAELDLERVICRLVDLEEHGSRAFTVGGGDWPLRGFVVRSGNDVRGYVNRCPHAGHPLDLRPGRFLTPDGALILCSSHGALFEKDGGSCLAGPCAGQSLRPIPLIVIGDVVLIAADADFAALTADG
jgi:nitrite reductase/ring-hydroxylating ferredoxin subunit